MKKRLAICIHLDREPLAAAGIVHTPAMLKGISLSIFNMYK